MRLDPQKQSCQMGMSTTNPTTMLTIFILDSRTNALTPHCKERNRSTSTMPPPKATENKNQFNLMAGVDYPDTYWALSNKTPGRDNAQYVAFHRDTKLTCIGCYQHVIDGRQLQENLRLRLRSCRFPSPILCGN